MNIVTSFSKFPLISLLKQMLIQRRSSESINNDSMSFSNNFMGEALILCQDSISYWNWKLEINMVKTSTVSLGGNYNKNQTNQKSRTIALTSNKPRPQKAWCKQQYIYVIRLIYSYTVTSWSILGVHCNVMLCLMAKDALFRNLTKCIHVGSISGGWWDGGGSGRREVKTVLRKEWSWKRGNGHRCRYVVRLEQRQEEKSMGE